MADLSDTEGKRMTRIITKYQPGIGEVTIEVPIKKKMKAPSYRTMMKWIDEGRSKATDGCWVEPDGRCPHGCKSWLLVLGVS